MCVSVFKNADHNLGNGRGISLMIPLLLRTTSDVLSGFHSFRTWVAGNRRVRVGTPRGQAGISEGLGKEARARGLAETYAGAQSRGPVLLLALHRLGLNLEENGESVKNVGQDGGMVRMCFREVTSVWLQKQSGTEKSGRQRPRYGRDVLPKDEERINKALTDRSGLMYFPSLSMYIYTHT